MNQCFECFGRGDEVAGGLASTKIGIVFLLEVVFTRLSSMQVMTRASCFHPDNLETCENAPLMSVSNAFVRTTPVRAGLQDDAMDTETGGGGGGGDYAWDETPSLRDTDRGLPGTGCGGMRSRKRDEEEEEAVED